MRGKAAVGGLLRQLRSLRLPRRWFADKGDSRAGTSAIGGSRRRATSHGAPSIQGGPRLHPRASLLGERAYRARLRRASTASNAASKEGEEERKLARSPKLAGKLPEAFDLSGRKRKIDNKRKMLMSRAFKDYTWFEFEGSGLDEHTRKEMARKKRAKQDFLPVDIPATWEAMEECFRKGLAKAIGVSNFSTKKLHDLLQHAKITPAVDQVELHPLWQQGQLTDLCKRNCVQVIAWSPLGGLGKPWGSKSVLEHPVIQEIALKHHKSPAQLPLSRATTPRHCWKTLTASISASLTASISAWQTRTINELRPSHRKGLSTSVVDFRSYFPGGPFKEPWNDLEGYSQPYLKN
ncbi:NADPH-dependent codeinone reductase 1-3 [Selaginella moellendorffii]|uniref:NADPH-dependent codeinone reductase 1-3 n=1 Tax=Selaginella moellendorffii TaxID=88036 RepID=UPI000D1CF37E|nr:NADPH-dependent codeinone reductase 1-3 [Selaginella moellendorffii]|eukprot:XP_024517142.1 NADPH-dependent codeinone reductase 1-3 [Selaginella moellendorffii]